MSKYFHSGIEIIVDLGDRDKRFDNIFINMNDLQLSDNLWAMLKM